MKKRQENKESSLCTHELIFTRIVPLTVCELASLILLHEKHVSSLHRLVESWDPHLLSGGSMEFAVSPSAQCHKYGCKWIVMLSNFNLI